MQTSDWIAIGSAIVSIAAFVATAMSAGSARSSAETAAASESRAAAGERQQAWRELLRMRARVHVLAGVRRKLVDHACFGIRSMAIATGHPGGEREQELTEETRSVLANIEQLEEVANQHIPQSTESDSVHVALAQLDGSVIRLESIADELRRQLARQDVDRLIDGVRLVGRLSRGST
jgi:hypothetical protein